MEDSEKKEWLDNLQKIKELVEAINVRFDIVVKTGEKDSQRVARARGILYNLEGMCDTLDSISLQFLA